MAVMGARMLPISQEVKLAEEWLEFEGELVFSCSILSVEPVERDISEIDILPLMILQAGYITCIILNWEGSDTVKRRVRHHRFAALVSVGKRT